MSRPSGPTFVGPDGRATDGQRPSTSVAGTEEARRRHATPGWRAGFTVNLALAMATATFLQFAIGALAPLLRADLGLSGSQVGVLATMFLASGAVFSPSFGARVDTLGSRRGFLALYAGCLVGYGLLAAMPTYAWMLLAVAIAGLPGAISHPLTNYAIAVHAGPGERGMMMGIKASGVQVATLLAGAVLPTLAVTLGWRAALLTATAVPLLGIVLTGAFVPRDSGRATLGSPPSLRKLLSLARRYPFLLWIAGYAMLLGGAMAAIGVYLPLYAYDELGFSVQLAGLAGSAVGFIGIPFRILWGRAVERRRERRAADLLLVGLSSIAAAIALQAAPTVGVWSLWLGVAVIGSITGGWSVIAMMAALHELPAGDSATGTGIIQLFFYGGLLSGPVMFGAVLDEFGRYAPAWSLVVAFFVLASVVIGIWAVRERWR